MPCLDVGHGIGRGLPNGHMASRMGNQFVFRLSVIVFNTYPGIIDRIATISVRRVSYVA